MPNDFGNEEAFDVSNTPEFGWYVVHTYSGYENKVMANIKKLVENRGMHDQILEVTVPMQDTVEIKDGQRKNVSRKVYPGYVFIKMNMNDETWYVVRNTRGVTSFVGPGSKPVALTEAEIKAMGIELTHKEIIDIDEGDAVRIKSGLFENSMGIVKEINHSKRMVCVLISMFGRETPLELEFTQVQKI
ncbi:MAG: transcription termination/antitermination protein NusG [Clostridiales bacterium]|jgi:transcriptional antiterminator NusG|nr:transcription termination/antitermination protein NusG [Clostridiales bacterium]